MGNKININMENLSDVHYVIQKVENQLRLILARQDERSEKAKVSEAKEEK